MTEAQTFGYEEDDPDPQHSAEYAAEAQSDDADAEPLPEGYPEDPEPGELPPGIPDAPAGDFPAPEEG